jgi:hypothetical protein
MKIESLRSWKDFLASIQQQKFEQYSIKKERLGYSIYTQQQISQGSYLTLGKIVSVSRILSEKKTDLELADLLTKCITKTIHQQPKFSLQRIFSNIVQRLNNFLHLRGFITDVEDASLFVKTLSCVDKKQDQKLENDSNMDFIGCEQLKLQQQTHLAKLQILAQNNQWQHIQKHTNHPDSAFDWWMFPTTWESSSYKKKYQLTPDALKSLQQDDQFMQNFEEGVKLVAKSWGWDIDKKQKIVADDLKWVGYNIRLEKMIHSAYLFQKKDLLDSLKLFIAVNSIHLSDWVKPYLK